MGLTSHAQRTNVRKRPFARTPRGRPSQGKSGSALGGIGRRGRSGRGLQQEMVMKFDVEAGSRAGNRSVVFVVRVIEDAVGLFFFSSRRRHTRSLRDWSSDVCSSDLTAPHDDRGRPPPEDQGGGIQRLCAPRGGRSEERRVGKECRSWWSPYD